MIVYIGPYLTEREFETPHIDSELAKRIGEEIGVDFDVIDLEQFRKGIEVELEHGSLYTPETDVIGMDLAKSGKIAWAHIKEIPDYYDRLEKMEQQA